jgi:Flp pilus assembly pilin Flp
MLRLKGLIRREKGQALTEYLLLAAVVSTGMLGVSMLFTQQIQQYLNYISDLLSKPF